MRTQTHAKTIITLGTLALVGALSACGEGLEPGEELTYEAASKSHKRGDLLFSQYTDSVKRQYQSSWKIQAPWAETVWCDQQVAYWMTLKTVGSLSTWGDPLDTKTTHIWNRAKVSETTNMLADLKKEQINIISSDEHKVINWLWYNQDCTKFPATVDPSCKPMNKACCEAEQARLKRLYLGDQEPVAFLNGRIQAAQAALDKNAIRPIDKRGSFVSVSLQEFCPDYTGSLSIRVYQPWTCSEWFVVGGLDGKPGFMCSDLLEKKQRGSCPSRYADSTISFSGVYAYNETVGNTTVRKTVTVLEGKFDFTGCGSGTLTLTNKLAGAIMVDGVAIEAGQSRSIVMTSSVRDNDYTLSVSGSHNAVSFSISVPYSVKYTCMD